MRVLCVTPNPSIDRTLIVPGFAAGGVWRATSAEAVCGGKGVNVARAVVALGGQAICAGILGGHGGRLAADLALLEGVESAWTWAGGETRTCVIVVNGEEPTVINEPGSVVAADDWTRLLADVAAVASVSDAVCVSGSLPPGLPVAALSALIAGASGSVLPVWVDTSGAALEQAVATAPTGIKINAAETAALLGRPVATVASAILAAEEIRAAGPRNVVVTLGAQGAVMTTEDGCWHARPPAIAAVSAVGSGDAFLAGLMVGFHDGACWPDALRLAVAAGAANALQWSARLDPADLRRLSPLCTVEPIR